MHHQLEDGKVIKLADEATLLEAVNWIAYRRPPAQHLYQFLIPEVFYWDACDFDDGARDLFYYFLENKIVFYGYEYDIDPNSLTIEPLCPFPDDKKVELKKVSYSALDFTNYNWDRSLLNHNLDGKCIAHIHVKTSELMQYFPAHKKDCSADTEANYYTTPFMELMKLAILENQISDENYPKHEDLVDWFVKNAPKGIPLSERQAKLMATFVRPPSAGTGGLKKKKIA